MRAMILAAGLGTRLKPITNRMPKPLVPVLGKPLIRHTLDTLKRAGIREVIINLHHLPRELRIYLKKQTDMRISFSLEKHLLGTGGGIAKARPFFKHQRFVVINSDVLMNLNLKRVIAFHKKNKALATIVVKQISPNNIYETIGISRQGKIVQFKSKKVRSPLIKTFFTGVHIMEPEIFNHFPKQKKFFCINDDVYTKLVKQKYPVFAYLYRSLWHDIGELSLYLKYHQKFLSKKKWIYFKENLLKLFPGLIFPKTLK